MDSPYGSTQSPYANSIPYDAGHGHPSRHPLKPLQHPKAFLQHSRPELTPSSRRASDQDVVLPSVEREAEPTVHKRKSFPHPMYEHRPDAVAEDYSERTIERMRPAHEQSRRETFDLTSSQSRPVYSNGREVYEVARPYAAPPAYTYAPIPPRRSPVRNTRGAYREVDFPQSSRAYAPGFETVHMAHDRRVVPTLDRVALSGPVTRHEVRDGPYMRSGAGNGYYAAR